MEKLTEEEFENIKKAYKNDEINIGVELSIARKILVENDETTAIWCLINSLLVILILLISFYSIGIFEGIGYTIIFYIFWNSYLGMCSVPGKAKKYIYYFCIAIIILAIFF